jgi:hypothetical protein
MKNFDVVLIDLHDQINFDRCNLIYILAKIEDLYPNDPLPEYARLLYLNYITLSELSYSIKEYSLLKDIIVHKF